MSTAPLTREAVAVKEQLDSRKRLDEFLDKVAKPARQLARRIKSEWFGRPDEELKVWMERGRAIAEIKDSLGYRLIMEQVEKEIIWAQNQLELAPRERNLKCSSVELRCYLKAMRFLQDFILTTERSADISSKVLASRAEEIGRETFVKGVANDRSGNN
jgi:hypothetical protein